MATDFRPPQHENALPLFVALDINVCKNKEFCFWFK